MPPCTSFIEKESLLSSTWNTCEFPETCCNFYACNGNDGYYDDGDKIAHSAREIKPYWIVDLGGVYTVYALEFFNRYLSSNPESEYITTLDAPQPSLIYDAVAKSNQQTAVLYNSSVIHIRGLVYPHLLHLDTVNICVFGFYLHSFD